MTPDCMEHGAPLYLYSRYNDKMRANDSIDIAMWNKAVSIIYHIFHQVARAPCVRFMDVLQVLTVICATSASMRAMCKYLTNYHFFKNKDANY